MSGWVDEFLVILFSYWGNSMTKIYEALENAKIGLEDLDELPKK